MSESLWMDGLVTPKFGCLTQNETHDVCIVGGGLGGIMTGYLLQKAGKSVCILEALNIGAGQTGRTTAHFSTALDDRYYRLENLQGAQGAKLAANSHLQALDLIERIVHDEKIECDYAKLPGYLFLGPDDSDKVIKKECAAARLAGLKDVSIVDNIPGLKFKSGLALCFPNQIQLHPLKFLFALTECFVALGGKVHGRTRVKEIKGGDQAQVVTEDGLVVRAQSIVVATNSPINDLFTIHTKQAPYRTYVIAARLPKNSVPQILFWDTEEPYHYVRTQADPESSLHDLVIVGGEDHKTGQNDQPEQGYLNLEKWMRERFPDAQEIHYRWSGQVMEPMDGMAYLGHNPMDKNNVYIITGDSGNGMTHCLIGAMLITDQIENRPNPWETLYQPSRKNMRAAGSFLKENANVIAQYGDWLSPSTAESESEILPGSGAVLREGTQVIAVFKDDAGACHSTSAVCPHLSGIVHWNSAENSWDCPCHGSRFNAYGRVIEGPACSNLKPVFRKPTLTSILSTLTEQKSSI